LGFFGYRVHGVFLMTTLNCEVQLPEGFSDDTGLWYRSGNTAEEVTAGDIAGKIANGESPLVKMHDGGEWEYAADMGFLSVLPPKPAPPPPQAEPLPPAQSPGPLPPETMTAIKVALKFAPGAESPRRILQQALLGTPLGKSHKPISQIMQGHLPALQEWFRRLPRELREHDSVLDTWETFTVSYPLAKNALLDSPGNVAKSRAIDRVRAGETSPAIMATGIYEAQDAGAMAGVLCEELWRAYGCKSFPLGQPFLAGFLRCVGRKISDRKAGRILASLTALGVITLTREGKKATKNAEGRATEYALGSGE